MHVTKREIIFHTEYSKETEINNKRDIVNGF